MADPAWGDSYLSLDWLARHATPRWAMTLAQPGWLGADQDVVVLERRG